MILVTLVTDLINVIANYLSLTDLIHFSNCCTRFRKLFESRLIIAKLIYSFNSKQNKCARLVKFADKRLFDFIYNYNVYYNKILIKDIDDFTAQLYIDYNIVPPFDDTIFNNYEDYSLHHACNMTKAVKFARTVIKLSTNIDGKKLLLFLEPILTLNTDYNCVIVKSLVANNKIEALTILFNLGYIDKYLSADLLVTFFTAKSYNIPIDILTILVRFCQYYQINDLTSIFTILQRNNITYILTNKLDLLVKLGFNVDNYQQYLHLVNSVHTVAEVIQIICEQIKNDTNLLEDLINSIDDVGGLHLQALFSITNNFTDKQLSLLLGHNFKLTNDIVDNIIKILINRPNYILPKILINMIINNGNYKFIIAIHKLYQFDLSHFVTLFIKNNLNIDLLYILQYLIQIRLITSIDQLINLNFSSCYIYLAYHMGVDIGQKLLDQLAMLANDKELLQTVNVNDFDGTFGSYLLHIKQLNWLMVR